MVNVLNLKLCTCPKGTFAGSMGLGYVDTLNSSDQDQISVTQLEMFSRQSRILRSFYVRPDKDVIF